MSNHPKHRRGEKIGWLGGWIGGFLWLGILSVIWQFQGRTFAGILGLLLFVLAATTIYRTAPWKHPAVYYRKLMLPIYALLLAAIALSVWLMDDPGRYGFKWPNLLALMPAVLPLVIAGKRRWNDANTNTEQEQKSSPVDRGQNN